MCMFNYGILTRRGSSVERGIDIQGSFVSRGVGKGVLVTLERPMESCCALAVELGHLVRASIAIWARGYFDAYILPTAPPPPPASVTRLVSLRSSPAAADRYPGFTMSTHNLLSPTPTGMLTPRTHAANLREQLPYSRPSTPQTHPNVIGFIGLVGSAIWDNKLR
jgi:hypothetical protein